MTEFFNNSLGILRKQIPCSCWKVELMVLIDFQNKNRYQFSLICAQFVSLKNNNNKKQQINTAYICKSLEFITINNT